MARARNISPVSPQRRAKATVCGRLRGLHIDLASSDNIEAAQAFLKTDHFSPNVYTSLSRFALHTLFSAAKHEDRELLDSPITRHGAAVAARLIRVSPNSYFDFCNSKKLNPQIINLKDILLRSEKTPLSFMDLPANVNAELEEAFGIKDDYSTHANERFRVAGDTEEEALLVHDEAKFQEVLAQAPKRKENGEAFGLLDRCPARTLLRKCIWPGLIGLAAAVPEAFEQHFQILAAERAARV